jgi:hypothetical protein
VSINGEGIDRAMWSRYATANTDHCAECGRRAEVAVSLVATEVGGKTGKAVVHRKVYLCDEHGQLRYGDALRKLLGTEVLKR